MAKKDSLLQFKVHLPNLLKEIASNNGMGILKIPLNQLRLILIDLTERASQINDAELNAIMCRLTLYSVADPESEDYDLKVVEQVNKKAQASKLKRNK